MLHALSRSRTWAAPATLLVTFALSVSSAHAATYVLRPNATVSNAWTVNPTGVSAYTVLDDALLQPTAPSTSSDYLNANANGPKVAEVHVDMQPLAPGDAPDATTAWAYIATGSTRTVTLELMTGATSLATTTIPASSAAAWRSVSTATGLTQAQVDDLRVKVTLNGSGGSTASFVYAAYVQLHTLGVLAASTSGTPSFNVTLDGTDKTPTYILSINVADTTNAPAGWNLTLAGTAFSTGGASPSTLSSNASTVTGASAACAVAPCVAPTNSISYPIALTAGAPPVKAFNATSGTGTGQHTISPVTRVSIPANTNAGTYTSTVTVTVASGP